MVLALNLPGAVQELKKALTNKEAIEALNRLSEEFFKTMGVVLFVRLSTIAGEEMTPIPPSIVEVISNFLDEPSFESWVQLQALCSDNLITRNDEVIVRYVSAFKSPVPETDQRKAREIIKGIMQLRGASSYDPPRIPRHSDVLAHIRLLRNFKSHQYDSNPMYETLTTLGIKELVVNIVEGLMRQLNIHLVVPIAIEKTHVKAAIITGASCEIKEIPHDSRYERYPGVCYVCYDDKEPMFRFRTELIRYDIELNRCYVYLRSKNNETVFESVPITGDIETISISDCSYLDLFGVQPAEAVAGRAEALEKKFGHIRMTGSTVHNLPDRLHEYVHRPEIERSLVSAISHRRDWKIAVGGGGGFGKTELSKEVVWQIIDEGRDSVSDILKFDTVIWVTAKYEVFTRGTIHVIEPTFRNLDDLVDSILYVTRNADMTLCSHDEKKQLVVRVLNSRENSLLFIDNLETLDKRELDRIGEFLDFLGNSVQSKLKVLLTSRTDYVQAHKLLIIEEMTHDESKQLLKMELGDRGASAEWFSEPILDELVVVTRRIPLLIGQCADLVAHGHSLEQLKSFDPKDDANPWKAALAFMCNLQWNDLSTESRKLLTAIAFWGGSIALSDARILSDMREDAFNQARSELFKRSFLGRHDLIDSKLTVLPPIAAFVRQRLAAIPEYEDLFIEREPLLRTPRETCIVPLDELSDEAALSHYQQRALAFASMGEAERGYEWCKEATKLFDSNASAWRFRAEYEFRYLEKDAEGRASYEKALELDPNNAEIYNEWAYWEHQRGQSHYSKTCFRRSISLNQEALKRLSGEADRKKITDFIASSKMKLAYIARNESYRTSSPQARYERDMMFRDVILLLERNLHEHPSTPQERKHNLIDYNVLANALLGMGDKREPLRSNLADSAVCYILHGLKIDPQDRDLWYTIQLLQVRRALLKRGIDVSLKSRSDVLKSLSQLQAEFEGARARIDSYLRELSQPSRVPKRFPSSRRTRY